MKFFLISLIGTLAIFCACTGKKKLLPIKSEDFPKGMEVYGKKNDSAFIYFSRVVVDSEDSLEIASAYTYMAWILLEAGDYFSSQENALYSQQYLDPQNKNHQYWVARNYENLGTTSLNLKQYDKALSYYDLAIKSEIDPAYHSYYLNNRAVAHQKKKQYREAIAIYQSVLDQKPDSIIEQARVLSNIARTKWLMDSTYPAASELLDALAIRKSKEDSWGLNASYAHLSDYYAGINKDSGLFYAKQMHNVATSLNSPDDELEALDKIIKLEQPPMAVKYFDRYRQLNDSIQQARNTAKNQFAEIRFDADKSKKENEVLQKDNTEKRFRINRQRIILFAVLFVVAALAVITTLWYKKRKQRFTLESANSLKEQELKMSKKVHDGVANGLYQLMTEIENKEIVKEKLLDRIEGLYEKSRDISYEPAPGATGSYEDKIHELLSSFSDESVKILIVGNNAGFWKNLSSHTKNELEYVLQELLINMKKHSRAKIVVVKFDIIEDHYAIMYTDDGIGMSDDVKFGNGLKNTETRIKAIGGTLNFEQEEGKGLKVNISF